MLNNHNSLSLSTQKGFSSPLIIFLTSSYLLTSFKQVCVLLMLGTPELGCSTPSEGRVDREKESSSSTSWLLTLSQSTGMSLAFVHSYLEYCAQFLIPWYSRKKKKKV